MSEGNRIIPAALFWCHSIKPSIWNYFALSGGRSHRHTGQWAGILCPNESGSDPDLQHCTATSAYRGMLILPVKGCFSPCTPWQCNPLTHSLREPGGPCTKSMEVSESHMERVKLMMALEISWVGVCEECLLYNNRTIIINMFNVNVHY